MPRDGPLSKERIELLASQMIQLINQKFPDLSGADVASIMGYASAFQLNSAVPDSLFRTYGQVCYDILNGDPNGTKEGSATIVGSEDGNVLGQPETD